VDVQISLVGRSGLADEIYRQLRTAIVEGRVAEGQLLPPTRELARRLSVSRSTVSTAYDRLIGEGFAIGKVGSGTRVAPNLARPAAVRRTHRASLRPRHIWDSVTLPTDTRRRADYDFRTGIPDASMFPYQTWRRLMNRALRPMALEDGMYGKPGGHPALREAIARHVGMSRGIHADPQDVIVTAGTQQAVDLIARVLVAPGDRVAVEDPGYGPPRRLFRTLGLRVSGVPVDHEGLTVDAIPMDTRLVYVSPSHQFPLGTTTSLRRRIALAAWADRTGGAIIEDDYDSEFRFGDRPIEPVKVLDRADRVILVGSFSKTMLPALRLGYMIVPRSIGHAVEAAKYLADWHTPTATQLAMAWFLSSGAFARHVRRTRTAYQARHRRIIETLRSDFAGRLEVMPSSVGLHLAAIAPDGSVDEIDSVHRRSLSVGVDFQPLARFAAGDVLRAGIVIGYGAIPLERIDEGLRRLRAAFDRGAR
jgi:GntR family transcriptional regulator / MocR family aminotransferase